MRSSSSGPMNQKPILLSAPDVGETERAALLASFDGGWIAPAGPDLGAFEQNIVAYSGANACVALSSGSAALHLALLLSDVRPGDEVVVQSATFAASAFAVRHASAIPVFIDSEDSSWCMDPTLLRDFLHQRAKIGRLPAAVMPVDLYGATANYAEILSTCQHYDVALIRDAAEALGSISDTGRVGEVAVPTVLSFNGNKIITTSSGGALLGPVDDIERARHLATQARLPVPHYEHEEIGFNYRMSNLLAALGSAQLAGLEGKIARRAAISEQYRRALPELSWCKFEHTPRPNYWLTVGVLPGPLRADTVVSELNQHQIEARVAWKPMHMQPVFADSEFVEGSGVAEHLFESGICLPSGSGLEDAQVQRVVTTLRSILDGQ